MDRLRRFAIKKAWTFAALFVLAPLPSFASSGKGLMVGSWECKYEGDGIKIEATEVYSRNNTFYGTGVFEVKVPDAGFDVAYSVSIAGKWKMLPGNVLESSGDLSMKNITSVSDLTPEQEAQLRLELDEVVDIKTMVKAVAQGSYDQIKFIGKDKLLSITEGDRDWSKATTCVRN